MPGLCTGRGPCRRVVRERPPDRPDALQGVSAALGQLYPRQAAYERCEGLLAAVLGRLSEVICVPSGQRFVDAECKRLGLYQRPKR